MSQTTKRIKSTEYSIKLYNRKRCLYLSQILQIWFCTLAFMTAVDGRRLSNVPTQAINYNISKQLIGIYTRDYCQKYSNKSIGQCCLCLAISSELPAKRLIENCWLFNANVSLQLQLVQRTASEKSDNDDEEIAFCIYDHYLPFAYSSHRRQEKLRFPRFWNIHRNSAQPNIDQSDRMMYRIRLAYVNASKEDMDNSEGYDSELDRFMVTCEKSAYNGLYHSLLTTPYNTSFCQSRLKFITVSELCAPSTDKQGTNFVFPRNCTSYILHLFCSVVRSNHVEIFQNGSSLRKLNESEINEYIRTSNALEIINDVGHALSFISISCIVATAISFKKWRRELSNKILLNMSAAILLNIPLFFIITYTTLDNNITTCLIFGIILHYSVLASFCWLLVMSGLQLMRLLTVLGVKTISHLLLKVAVFAWGTPLIPIITLVAWNTDFYTNDMQYRGYCFPSGIALLTTVRIPLYIILTINLVVFIVILCRIYACFGWGEKNDLRKHGDTDQAMHRFRTSFFLFFLLGLPWTIGYFQYDPISFAYLYSITTSNQGIMLFVFFILLDKKTMSYWNEAFSRLKSRFKPRSKRTSSSTIVIEVI